jgi:hypothetical protein
LLGACCRSRRFLRFLAFPLLQPSLFALKFLTGLRTRPPQRNLRL